MQYSDVSSTSGVIGPILHPTHTNTVTRIFRNTISNTSYTEPLMLTGLPLWLPSPLAADVFESRPCSPLLSMPLREYHASPSPRATGLRAVGHSLSSLPGGQVSPTGRLRGVSDAGTSDPDPTSSLPHIKSHF